MFSIAQSYRQCKMKKHLNVCWVWYCCFKFHGPIIYWNQLNCIEPIHYLTGCFLTEMKKRGYFQDRFNITLMYCNMLAAQHQKNFPPWKMLLIGLEWSRSLKLNTYIWLAENDHVTWILVSDWPWVITWQESREWFNVPTAFVPNYMFIPRNL